MVDKLEKDSKVNVCGIIGDPVAHSLSPVMHNAAFGHLALNWVYLPFKVNQEHLREAVAGIKALNIAGVNITIPHKEAVFKLVDETSEQARLMGAVNTIVNRNGRLYGYNTDGAGFLTALLEQGFSPGGKSALVVGAGGAARAVVTELARHGCSVALVNRSSEKAMQLGAWVEKMLGTPVDIIFSGITPAVIAEFDLIVNATPVGMYPDVFNTPFSPEGLRPGQLVYDLIYNPVETKLVRWARQSGADAVGGSGMLLYQGALAFELWTGLKAPVDKMKTALLEALGNV